MESTVVSATIITGLSLHSFRAAHPNKPTSTLIPTSSSFISISSSSSSSLTSNQTSPILSRRPNPFPISAAAASSSSSSQGEETVIVLDVKGMMCDGCASSVKRMLESQSQVSSANVDLSSETATVLPVPEAKASQNWQQQLGEILAKHLTNCGFESKIRAHQ